MIKLKLLMLGALLTFCGRSWAEVLPMQQCSQEHSYWCWIATSQCVLANDGVSQSQCGLMQFVLQQQNVAGDACKDPEKFDWGEQVVGVAKILENWNIATTLVNHPLSFDQIRAQISQKNPIVRHIVWSGGGAHDTVVRGFSNDTAGAKLVHVMDPAAGLYVGAYDDVVANEYGSWDISLTTNSLASKQPWSGIDLPGSDFKHFEVSAGPIATSLPCADACWKTEGCVAWTYVRPNTMQGQKGQCWLKNAMPKQVPDSCCESGTVGEQSTDRPGGDYKHFDSINGQSVTPQSCNASCLGEPKCLTWTFVKPNSSQGPKGVCWLKDSVQPPIRNDACISAIVWRPPVVR